MSDNHDLLNDKDVCSFEEHEAENVCSNKDAVACGDCGSFVPTETKAGMKVSNLYISQVKRKCGIEVGKNYNLPKNEDSRQPQCPEDKESAIVEALKHFKMNS